MDRAKLVLPLIALSLIACGNKKIVGYKDNYIERKIYESKNDEEERLTKVLTAKYNKKNLPEEDVCEYYVPLSQLNSGIDRKSITTYKYDKKWRLIEKVDKNIDVATDNSELKMRTTTYAYEGNTTITKTISNMSTGIVSETEEKVTITKIKNGKKKERMLNSQERNSEGSVISKSTRTSTEIFDKFNRSIELHILNVEDSNDHKESTSDTIVTFEDKGDNYVSKTINSDNTGKASSVMEIGKFEKSESVSNSEIVQYNYKDGEFKTIASGHKEITSKDSKNNTEIYKSYSLENNSNDEGDWSQRNESSVVYTFDKKKYSAVTSKFVTRFRFVNNEKTKWITEDTSYTNDNYGRCIEDHLIRTAYNTQGEATNKEYIRTESKYDKPIPIYKK